MRFRGPMLPQGAGGWIAGSSSKRFRVKWVPVRVKKTRQNENLEPGTNLIRTRPDSKAATYKISPFGPIGLPALSGFSTPRIPLEHDGPSANAPQRAWGSIDLPRQRS